MTPQPIRTRRSPASGALARLYRPQLALLVKDPPEGDEWLHEIKYDGYRIGCLIDGDRVTLVSRNGNDWTDSFPEIRDAARRLRARDALIDGEVAVVLKDGRTSFQALQNAFGGASRAGLVYFVFDLIALDGEDVAGRPLEARKDRLRRLLGRQADAGRIQYSAHVAGHGPAFLKEACRLGLEGIVSKRRDLPYRPGRHGGWLKIKCSQRQEFVIGGFTDPEGSRQGIGALLVGVHDRDGALVFAGKVGTGFTQKSAVDLRRRLEEIAQTDCPFTPPPPGALARRAHWVKPRLVCEVEYTERTADGSIRHPSFKGLREDKRPAEVVMEEPVPNPPTPPAREATAPTKPAPRSRTAKQAAEVAGVRITNPDRILYPEAGITKLDLAHFYEQIESWIVPHVAGRPLTLVRCPKGLAEGGFYMKHAHVWAPPALKRVRIPEKAKIGEYLIADSLAGIVSLVQMDVLEIHTWNSVVERVERPDRIVFDIDPGEKVAWTGVVDAARLVRSVLEALGLASFVKTTGRRGLHVVVPIAPHLDWSECLAFSRRLAEAIARCDPAIYTTRFAKAGRAEKILIDYLRNNRGNTSIAAYSTRAKPAAPVAVPVAWEELTPRLRPERFTVRTLRRRLVRLARDPWHEYWTLKQRVDRAALNASFKIG